MSNTQNYLITFSFISWFIIIVIELIRNRYKKGCWISSGMQIFFILFIIKGLNRYFGYFNTIEEKGATLVSEGVTIGGLYVFTVLGILGHHLFAQIRGLHEQEKQKKLKWFPVLKPLSISPIIFIAVLSQLEKMGAQTNTVVVVLMQFLLAFQNGFFGKRSLNRPL